MRMKNSIVFLFLIHIKVIFFLTFSDFNFMEKIAIMKRYFLFMFVYYYVIEMRKYIMSHALYNFV